jgi:hypothetical protein
VNPRSKLTPSNFNPSIITSIASCVERFLSVNIGVYYSKRYGEIEEVISQLRVNPRSSTAQELSS